MPVTYGHDARGSFIVAIEFSRPPTGEEKAALIAFGGQKREAVNRDDTVLGERTRKKNAQASLKASAVRQQNRNASDQAILQAARDVQRQQPELSLNAIAQRLARTRSRLRWRTIARKLSPLKTAR